MCERDTHGPGRGGITELVDEIIVGLVNHRIYGFDHTRVRDVLDRLVRKLEILCADPAKEGVLLGVADGYLIHEGRPLLDASLAAPRLIRTMEGMGGSGLEIDRGAGEDDFRTLLTVVEEARKRNWSVKDAQDDLAFRHCSRIRFLEAATFDEVSGKRLQDGLGVELPSSIPIGLYHRVLDELQGLSIDVCQGNRLDVTPAKGQIEGILKQLEADAKALMNLARYESYDAFTFGHSIRVCFLALTYARHVAEDPDLRNSVGLAALLHDVGKSLIPFEILHSRTRLSVEERKEMEKHALFGARILMELDDPEPMAVTAAMGHHRSLDGGGYPSFVKGVPVTAATRLVKICDVFEALTAVRPYKDAMSPARAYRIMFSMRGHFDQVMLKQFVMATGLYPAGTTVRLIDGRVVRVEEQSGDLLRPVVSTLDDEPRVIDLSEESDAPTVEGVAERVEVA
ncbi:MAG: HD domain-containing protein [Planctomycetota bacterium]